MNYLESIAYIESLTPTILNPSLDRFSLFMSEHGSLQDKLVTIHIAGTNGKGSTVAIVDSVLRAAGLRVGRFTGPHLLRWNERFHLNGEAISDETFADYASRLRSFSEAFGKAHPQHGALTWFEFLTAIAFFYFLDNNVDAAVFEVGLGGRWDATNVLAKPAVTAITSIDLDHTHILGDTIPKIAAEKAGIIKPGVPVVTACKGEALDTIAARAEELGAPLFACEPPYSVQPDVGLQKDLLEEAYARLALLGSHQISNALVAAAVVSIAERAIKRPLLKSLADGFGKVYWPGRFQFIGERNLIMDGAHNVAGVRSLRRSLDELFPEQPRTFVLGFFQNKDVEGALDVLIRPGDIVFACEAKSHRAVWAAEDIATKCRAHGAEATVCNSVEDGVHRALKTDRLVVVAGSFATIQETMLTLQKAKVDVQC